MGTRFRIKHSFWLEMDKQDHIMIADTITALKAERSFATVIRDGIMLVSRLRAGDIDLLLKLFPWVEQAILERHKSSSGGPGGGDLDKLQQQIDVLRQLILSIPSNEKKPDVAAQPIGQGNPRPLPVAAVPGPADEDDSGLLNVKKAASDGFTAAHNFLQSCGNLMH